MLRSHSLILSMKINRSTISLNGLKFKSKIGLYDFERDQGNNFIVNISVDSEKIRFNDKINGTVNYEKKYSIVESEMSVSCNLMETVAHNISKRIHSELENIKLCKIEIIKENPKIVGDLDNSSFILETTN